MSMDHTRDPCPWVALRDFGGAFCMGAIGGALWHTVKAFRYASLGTPETESTLITFTGTLRMANDA
ncbi:hypothetical protein PtrM4_024790 [Pyrenophora tritici-repentis]|uniref:Uncharacterized protein n=1 Tax=Pyrenophora tritici-repentis TaxID=45151 RepID=A0A834S9D5_9PLEO|nr:hypothetical protein PtrM4_024790 [Pyrenophora tritici-repentis]KAI1689116.1 mitochondrial import inner membrane translocase protein [Pyrenophora tritici-repentis]